MKNASLDSVERLLIRYRSAVPNSNFPSCSLYMPVVLYNNSMLVISIDANGSLRNHNYYPNNNYARNVRRFVV